MCSLRAKQIYKSKKIVTKEREELGIWDESNRPHLCFFLVFDGKVIKVSFQSFGGLLFALADLQTCSCQGKGMEWKGRERDWGKQHNKTKESKRSLSNITMGLKCSYFWFNLVLLEKYLSSAIKASLDGKKSPNSPFFYNFTIAYYKILLLSFLPVFPICSTLYLIWILFTCRGDRHSPYY